MMSQKSSSGDNVQVRTVNNSSSSNARIQLSFTGNIRRRLSTRFVVWSIALLIVFSLILFLAAYFRS